MRSATVVALSVCAAAPAALASSPLHFIDFQTDPALWDANMDGFITGTEFSPGGLTPDAMPDGVQFTFSPITNLVGNPRLLLDPATGLHFGGGGGSTLAMSFTTNMTIDLEVYNTSSSGFILGNPTFDIEDDMGAISTGNNADVSGLFSAFEGGPLRINAGETYTFQVTNSGAAIQSYMAMWQYVIVPAPGAATLLAAGGLLAIRRRR